MMKLLKLVLVATATNSETKRVSSYMASLRNLWKYIATLRDTRVSSSRFAGSASGARCKGLVSEVYKILLSKNPKYYNSFGAA
jgi:hypothetical protein